MLVYDVSTQYPAAILIFALRYDFENKKEEKKNQDTLFLFLFQMADRRIRRHTHTSSVTQSTENISTCLYVKVKV